MLRLLAVLVAAQSDTTGCAAPASAPARTVCGYLAQLRALDHGAMAKYWAPDMIVVRPDGSRAPIDTAAMRNFREFERAAHDKWDYVVRHVRGDTVIVTEVEASDFYDLLGTGPRIQTTAYVVRGPMIAMRMISDVRQAGDFDATYAAFKRWLLAHPEAAGDATLSRGDGGLWFNGRSAAPMLRWLERWRAVGRPGA